MRIFVESRRNILASALATSSYALAVAKPFVERTFVIAAVSVVLPWSMCPMVPTFTWGFLRWNFSLAIVSSESLLGPSSQTSAKSVWCSRFVLCLRRPDQADTFAMIPSAIAFGTS